MILSTNTRKAYSEIDEFLELVSDKQKNKIPQKLREIFKKEKDTNYIKKINPSEPIKNQNLKEETLGIISLLNLQYWCEDEKEKQRLKDIYEKNEQEYQEKLKVEFNPDGIFKKKQKEKRNIIEATVRKCTSRLNNTITEEQIQSMIDRLVEMKNIKDVVDSLALNIDKFFGKPEQKEQYEACIEDLLKLAGKNYKSKEDIIFQIQNNKSKNYIPGNISVEENHQLIQDSLKKICDKLNELGVDYYLVGALSTFIGTRNTII